MFPLDPHNLTLEELVRYGSNSDDKHMVWLSQIVSAISTIDDIRTTDDILTFVDEHRNIIRDLQYTVDNQEAELDVNQSEIRSLRNNVSALRHDLNKEQHEIVLVALKADLQHKIEAITDLRTELVREYEVTAQLRQELKELDDKFQSWQILCNPIDNQ